jgi:hypothetical protein
MRDQKANASDGYEGVKRHLDQLESQDDLLRLIRSYRDKLALADDPQDRELYRHCLVQCWLKFINEVGLEIADIILNDIELSLDDLER